MVGPIQTNMTKYSAKMFNLFEVCFNMNIGKTKVIVTKTKLKLRNAHQTYFGLICKLLWPICIKNVSKWLGKPILNS